MQGEKEAAHAKAHADVSCTQAADAQKSKEAIEHESRATKRQVGQANLLEAALS